MEYLDFNVVRMLGSYGLTVDGLVDFSDSMDDAVTDSEWEWLKKKCYRKNMVALIGSGFIDFTKASFLTLIRGCVDKYSYTNDMISRLPNYDAFLDIQRENIGKARADVARIYFDAGSYVVCYGKIQKFSHIREKRDKVCIEKVTIYNPHSLDVDWNLFTGTLDHIWVESCYFEGMDIGDNVKFEATISPYLKTGNGKQIDYGLEVSDDAEQIDDYYWPTKEDVRNSIANRNKCASCLYNDYCYGHCLA